MANEKNDRLAVLIDADNAQASLAAELLAEIAQYGRATVKRAYGDWTTPNLRAWKEILHKHAIQPIQQFAYTAGKNATDSSLIIDAMDLLHSRSFDGFCLVSSDSDFTPLATRLKESGAAVYGFGERKTPDPFVSACDKFTFTEILRPQLERGIVVEGGESVELKDLLRKAIDETSKDDGWSNLGEVGGRLSKLQPSFDSRNYGFSKLSNLVRAESYVEVKTGANGDGPGTVYVRLR